MTQQAAMTWLRENWLTVAIVALLYVGVSVAKMPVPTTRGAYVLWYVVRWASFLTSNVWGGRLKLPFTAPVIEEPPPFELPKVTVTTEHTTTERTSVEVTVTDAPPDTQRNPRDGGVA